MKTSAIPLACGIALTAMSTAALSHWWSVRQFVAAVDAGLPVAITPTAPGTLLPAPEPRQVNHPATLAARGPESPPAANESPKQKDFYESLIRRMENLQNQNRDLLDQVAETNRDLMKLEFRVDTHSDQFRPLPVSEDRLDTSFDIDSGVLPPRAEPVTLPVHE